MITAYNNKMKYKDITGEKFGKLTAISYNGSTKDGRAKWLCICECGNETTVLASSLKSGNTTSCGCVLRSKIKQHGMSGTKIYQVWLSMKTRCNNQRSNRYEYYGGRDITYGQNWESFEDFYTDMNEEYSDGLTLDRKDSNQGYSKSNCRWVNHTVQNNNKSDNILLYHNGRLITVKEVSKLTGLSITTIYNRKQRGWSDKKVITTPIKVKFINHIKEDR